MKKKKHYKNIIVISLSVVSLLWIQVANAVPGGLGKIIPFTGRLVDSTGQVVANGDYRMRVRIFDADTAGTQLYEELFDNTTDYGSGACPEQSVQNGYFRIEIGVCNTITTDAYKSLYNNTELYTEISLDFDKDGTYEEVFAPRRRLGLAPGAVSALQLVSNGDGVSTNNLYINQNGHLNFDGVGNFGIGLSESDPSSAIQIFKSGQSARIALEGTGDGFNYSTIALQGNGNTWNIHHRQAGGEDGNFSIEEFDGSNFNSRLTISPGGNVGLGTVNPQAKLQLYADTGSVFDALRISNDAGSGQSQISFEENGQDENFVIRYNGGDNQLEFWGGASGTISNLIEFDRDDGDISTIGKIGVGSFTTKNDYLDIGVFSSGFQGIGIRNQNEGSNTGTKIGLYEGVSPAQDGFEIRYINSSNQLEIGRMSGGSFSSSMTILSSGVTTFPDLKWGTSSTASQLKNDQGGSIELGGYGVPYIDFKNDTVSDFDVRLQLNGDDRIDIRSGYLAVNYVYDLDNFSFISNPSGTSQFNTLNAVSGNTVSDSRLKTNVNNLSSALDLVNAMQGVRFNWRETDLTSDTGRKIGFIAQDLAQVVPEVVNYNEQSGYYGVEYGSLVAVMVEAIKELDTRTKLSGPTITIQDVIAGLESKDLRLANLTLTGDGVIQGDLKVKGDVEVGGVIKQNVKTVTESYTIGKGDSIVYANLESLNTTDVLTITIPESIEEIGATVRVRFIGGNAGTQGKILYSNSSKITPERDFTYEFVRTESGWLPI